MPAPISDQLFVAAAGAARASRLRGAFGAYARAVETALGLVWPRRIEPFGADPTWLRAPVARIEPVSGTRGGWFSTIVVAADGARFFAKAVSARGRERAFWRAWAEGGVVVEGAHFRLVPPLAQAGAGAVTLLVFPEVPALERRRRSRKRYCSIRGSVVRAIAEFSAIHPAARVPLPPPLAPRAPPLGPSALGRRLGVAPAEAARLAARLRAVEAAWPRLDPLPATHIAHLDFGTTNAAPDGGRVIVQDFGHAAPAAPGADLHSVLRWGRAPGAAPFDLRPHVEAYVAGFGAEGVALDADLVLQAAERHFAARYRNPRQSSSHEVLAEALALSERLLEDG